MGKKKVKKGDRRPKEGQGENKKDQIMSSCKGRGENSEKKDCRTQSDGGGGKK